MVVPKKNPEKSSVFQINFSQTKDKSDVYSIDFFKDAEILFDGKAKSDLTLYTLGSSIVYFLPIIWTVASSGNYKLSKEDAEKIAKQKSSGVKESYKYWIGAIEYHIYENLSQNIIDETFKLEQHGTIFNGQTTINVMENELRGFKKKKMDELRQARKAKDENKTKENVDKWKQIIADIQDIDSALKGGATTLGELKVAVKHNVSIIAEIDKELEEADGAALIAMSGLSAGAKGLGASLKTLFLSNPVGLALMAVTAITAIVSAVKRAKEEAKQAAQETLNA